MKRMVWMVLCLMALAIGDASYFFSAAGTWNARWDGAEKRSGNWISAEGAGRNGICQQGEGITDYDAAVFKNGLKALYRNNTGQAMVLPPCELVQTDIP